MASLATTSLLLGMYSQFLPSGDEGQKLFQVLSSFDLSEKTQEALPYVTFQSGESLSDRGNPVLNRVSLIARGDYDFWLMRQYISPKKSLPASLPKWQTWAFVGILVDRSKEPVRAYYFEFDSSPLHDNSLPNLIPFRASCSKCHSSGPRVIRPHVSPNSLFKTLESKRNILEEWNQRIAQYRTVKDFLSNHESKMFPTTSSSSEILKLGLCAECHNSKSDAIRGALNRKNAESILYLVETHEMPMHDDDALPQAGDRRKRIRNKKLLKCLKDWAYVKDASVKVVDANMRLEKCVASAGPVKAAQQVKQVKQLDHVSIEQSLPKTKEEQSDVFGFSVKNMELSAKVELSLGHSMEISGIKIKSLQFHCQKPSACTGVAELDLAHLTTGIQLRDRHLSSWVKRNRALSAKVDMKFLNPIQKMRLQNQKEMAFLAQAQVALEGGGGRDSETDVTITCRPISPPIRTDVLEWQCRVESRQTFFKPIEDDKPCFLGVCVSPYITVDGQFVLAANAR